MEQSRFSNKGFTLIEILMVVVVIGILGGIVMAASSYMTRVSRQKRLIVTQEVLETAIYRYRAEYGDWPCPAGKEADNDDKITISGEENKEVFGPLRMSSPSNPDGIQFIDETTVLTWEKNLKKVIPLSDAKKKEHMPLIFINRDGKHRNMRGALNYFKVVFNVVDETVEVQAP